MQSLKKSVILAKNTKFIGISKAGNPIEMYKGMDAQLAKILSKRDARGAKGRWVSGEPGKNR